MSPGFIYGVVALIVRLDDMGLSLVQKYKGWRNRLGQVLIKLSPKIVKVLGIVGTIAMFLVGGGIVAHFFHVSLIPQEDSNNMIVGIISGSIVFFIVEVFHYISHKLKSKKEKNV